jgi:hypothetical protein
MTHWFPIVLTWVFAALACSQTADTTAPDGGTDPVDVSVPTCEWNTVSKPSPDPERTHFALSLFHYNVEYVIGGLHYTDQSGEEHLFMNLPLSEGWSDEKVEDWIITETLSPILDLYDAHPSWGVDLEMQGRLIDVLAERHPTVLTQLRTLAQRSQVELISFHQNDQLFLAFPREDLERSIAHTKSVFAAHCLPLSDVVFNQEGQAGEGRQRMLVEQGYQIGVFPKNLYRYVQGDTPWWPWYSSEGGTLIVGPGEVDPTSNVTVAWDFFDDGELRSVEDGINPYMAAMAVQNAPRVAEFEAKLQAREDAGYHLTTIGDYIHHLEVKGVEKPPAPPLLDGTWQPQSTHSIHRWLGGRSNIWTEAEEDNRVRSGNAEARMHVAATQVLLDHVTAAGLGDSNDAKRMHSLWQMLWRAQVSDASGVNPWRGEVLFGIEMNQTLWDEGSAYRNELLDRLGSPHATVDLESRTVTLLEAPIVWEDLEDTEPALDIAISTPGRTYTTRWQTVAETQWRWTLQVDAAGTAECEVCDDRLVSVSFPRTEEFIRYCPGLIEDEVRHYPLDVFTLMDGEVYLPLANGLIGLGEDWWVIKHTRRNHIAARIRPDTPDVAFLDETIPEIDKATWKFDLFKGSDTGALDAANRLNITPQVHY